MSAFIESISGEKTAQQLIAVTVDTKFLAYGLFVLNQIAKLHPNRKFDLVIVTTDDLPDHPLIAELNIRVCRLSSKVLSQDFPHSNRISIATYLRFYLSRALADYKRILYLDSDLFIQHGDFERLMSIDMGNHSLAGVRDPAQFRHPKRTPKDMIWLEVEPFRYLSAGVQLIDVARFNEQKIGERAVDLAVSKPDKMIVYDQTAINAVLQGRFAELPPGWNWHYGFRTLYFTELYAPPILHFAGRRKPWNTLNGEFPKHYSAVYRSFFEAHFPELAKEMPECKPPSSNRIAHLRYLFNHLNGLRRLVPAFDQFEDDFDIKL